MSKDTKVTPIFIFSLPRAGSTLLQRIIGADEKISFTGEPWILLPFFYSMKEKGVLAEYNHKVMTQGTHSFTEDSTLSKKEYYTELKSFIERLYTSASAQESLYFIDKTPRYHFIVDEILKVFDDAKFIFLWRHPLAVQSSCLETWCSGKWDMHHFGRDQYGGLGRLIAAYEANKERAWAINYESLVNNPEPVLKSLFEDYLKLDFHSDIVNNFSKQKLKGRMWDPTGVKSYASVDSEPLEKWKITMSGILRQQWCYRYLDWIGEERLDIMGYNINVLKEEVNSLPKSFSGVGSDVARMIYGEISYKFEKVVFKGKLPFMGL